MKRKPAKGLRRNRAYATKLDRLASIVHDIAAGKTTRTKEWVYEQLIQVDHDATLDMLREGITTVQANEILRSTRRLSDELEGKRSRGKP